MGQGVVVPLQSAKSTRSISSVRTRHRRWRSHLATVGKVRLLLIVCPRTRFIISVFRRAGPVLPTRIPPNCEAPRQGNTHIDSRGPNGKTPNHPR